MKNLNSFKAVEKAIFFETERHIDLIEAGEKVIQETRGWDETEETTFSQRLKEESHDYRYFPDPDLPKLYISKIPDFAENKLLAELRELPWQKRDRLKKEFGLKDEDVEVYVRSLEWGGYFEKVISYLGKDKKLILLASNYITSDLAGLRKADQSLGFPEPLFFAELIKMVSDGLISSRGAKETLSLMLQYDKKSPHELAKENNLIQKSDEGELEAVVKKIIDANATVAADFKNGKQTALQFLIGQAMKETKGSANPEVLKKLFVALLV